MFVQIQSTDNLQTLVAEHLPETSVELRASDVLSVAVGGVVTKIAPNRIWIWVDSNVHSVKLINSSGLDPPKSFTTWGNKVACSHAILFLSGGGDQWLV